MEKCEVQHLYLEERDPYSQLSLLDMFLIGCSFKIHPSLTPSLLPQRQHGAICLHLLFIQLWVLLPLHLAGHILDLAQ